MSNSPNMSLPIPVASVTSGPEWASDIQSSLNIVDSHTHNPGSGVPITPSGININADLTMGSNNLTSINSLILSTHAGTASLVSLYSDGTNLYYKDGSGNAVQITSGGNVNAGAGSITGLPSGTAGVSYTAISGTYTFTQATSTAANIDAATLIIRYPGSYPTPSGNFISLQAPSSLATGYSLTLPATLAATAGAILTSNTAGVISYVNTDSALSSGATLEISGGTTLQIKALGVNTAQLAAGSVTQAKLEDSVSSGTGVSTAKIVNGSVTGAKIASNVGLTGTDITANGKSVVTMSADTTVSFNIIRGEVAIGGGAPNYGEGFTVPAVVSAGVYHVNYTNVFSSTPAVTVCPVGTLTVGNLASESNTGFVVNFFNLAGVATNTAFTFIAVGPG